MILLMMSCSSITTQHSPRHTRKVSPRRNTGVRSMRTAWICKSPNIPYVALVLNLCRTASRNSPPLPAASIETFTEKVNSRRSTRQRTTLGTLRICSGSVTTKRLSSSFVCTSPFTGKEMSHPPYDHRERRPMSASPSTKQCPLT